ncbi:MAG: cellobiose phosphorylase [Candidatus Omnitrophica bacterium]|nr:cellobiose phosphorylase [Candidatus Omnitrophota bacterium]
MSKETLWKFLDDNGTFVAKDPHKVRRLCFPLANEKGLLSSITPTLHGDIKLNQDCFLTPPVTTEDLRDSRYNRNFWVYIKGIGAWSAASGEVDESLVEAGMLWHKTIRLNKKIGLKAEFTNFIPVNNDAVEIMSVELTNVSKKELHVTPTAAIPIYGRSADRLRDHRYCSALLNRIKTNTNGVVVTPTMVFNELGHKINATSYFVLGCEGSGTSPLGSFSTVLEFSGEQGNLDKPEAVIKNISPKRKSIVSRQGKEAIGALRFRSLTLKPGKSKKYIILMGITQEKPPETIFRKFNSRKKIDTALSANKEFWNKKSNSIYLTTGNKDFDRWFKWVALQPTLRKIFGNSFLPDFDYGRGGRGWRDLWQDCLTLLMTNPSEARGMLINNFAGVRTDGSNATIIGKKQGEFMPDRNDIPRVWMDHGMWPFITLDLYINQTGDRGILYKKAPYFESRKNGTVLDHILRQHKRPFTKFGKHGNFRLEGADWNDGLDMAAEKGESVAFTAAYAGNLYNLAEFPLPKGERVRVRGKADRLIKHIRKKEWVKTKAGYSFFNGYYDNKGRRVEGDHKNGVRMTLTGQVFPIMSGVATDKQVKQIWRSAKKYLRDKRSGGFRLNTDFGEIYPDLGRAFGFAYGEKENGAFFSHMNIMFAYALYKRGFVKEGFEVLNSIYKMCMHQESSKIYPGLPEYFNSDGRGMYHYLTGSASWFVLTMLTQVFGIRGEMGNLVIDPKLVKEQFKKSKDISVNTYFAGRKITVNYLNPKKLDHGKYRIGRVTINGNEIKDMPVKLELFLKLTSKSSNIINVSLY